MFRRYISTTPVLRGTKDKIEVQLLKDFVGIGVRGQVVKVLPSRMRNQLHPNNGAAYVLPNVPPRIPVVEVNEQAVEKKKKKAKKAAEAAETEDPVSEVKDKFAFLRPKAKSVSPETQSSEETQTTTQSKKIQLEFEDFDSGATSDDSLFKYESLKSLPKVLEFEEPIAQQGERTLQQSISKQEIASRLNTISDYEYFASELSLLANGEPVEEIKQVGTYELGIQIATFDVAKIRVKITNKFFK